MADVEKININSTDYDIADAKALRTKDNVGTNSFIDTNSGTTTYPTAGNNLNSSIVIGDGAYFSGTGNSYQATTIIGQGAYGNNSYETAIGKGAYCNNTYATAVGYSSGATNYGSALGASARAINTGSVAIGYNASAPTQYATSIGYNATTSGNSHNLAVGAGSAANSQYSTALGANAYIGTNAVRSTAIGYNSSINNNMQYAIAIGSGASTAASYAVQLGSGTNNAYGTLQYRSWQLVDNNGKIPADRLPETARIIGVNPPNLYDWNAFNDNDNKIDQSAFLWTGETNSVFTKDQFYKGVVNYARPRFECSWTAEDYVTSQKDIIIDQNKLFLKLAEISQARIDDDDTANSVIGGDNASQDMYFYYNGNSQQWWIEFGNDSIENGFTSAPDSYEFEGGETLADFGIYINEDALNLPTEDSDEDIFDLVYYAPIYCEGQDISGNISCTIDYMKFMYAMCDSDWGFAKIISDLDSWEYEVGENTYAMPILPPTYEYDGEELNSIIIRFEYYHEQWNLYINGEDTGYAWEDAQLLSTFGINNLQYIQDGEYIEFEFMPARQCSWEQFDPVDMSHFASTTQLSSLTSEVNGLKHWAVKVVNNNTADLNSYTTDGWYYFNGTNVLNRPSAVSRNFLLLVINYVNYTKQILFASEVTSTINSSSIRSYAPTMFHRVKNTGTWVNWQTVYSGDCANFITGFDRTKQQKLIHDNSSDASSAVLKWVEDTGGGSATYDSTNERITW